MSTTAANEVNGPSVEIVAQEVLGIDLLDCTQRLHTISTAQLREALAAAYEVGRTEPPGIRDMDAS